MYLENLLQQLRPYNIVPLFFNALGLALNKLIYTIRKKSFTMYHFLPWSKANWAHLAQNLFKSLVNDFIGRTMINLHRICKFIKSFLFTRIIKRVNSMLSLAMGMAEHPVPSSHFFLLFHFTVAKQLFSKCDESVQWI